jgi:outer membrane protein OmpA-like peptidoglycan-associated protein
MFSKEDDDSGAVLGLIFGLVALVVASVLGFGIYQANFKAKATAAPDSASVKVENGVVKFYFASGKSEVAAGGNEALADVVKAIAVGKKAVVSGFNDATGDAAKNAELSKARAFAVRDALKALGVAEDKIELKKPENTTAAAGSSVEARRVEVSIQ